MALTATQMTPQRPLPGAYLATPAPGRQQRPSIPQPNFRSNSSTTAPQATQSSQQRAAPLHLSGPVLGAVAQMAQAQSLTPIERAARNINDTLSSEALYPELDNYVGQGISGDYELPTPAWHPFQKVKNYDIPEQIFEQANLAQVSTQLGLFAELNHAYIVIDSSLYLWDYTHPNPELIGYEEQSSAITAVRLIKPRQGVFVPSITHLLVVATHAEIVLIGVAAQPAPSGGNTVALYSTRMSVPVRGIAVNHIEASLKTGRIFFGGNGSDDVWELTYQQEERWFASRCGKINHTTTGFASALQTLPFSGRSSAEHVQQMVVDDTRDLLYTLSSKSTIRVFHMKAGNVLDHALTRAFSNLLSNIGHMVPRSDLLGPNTRIVAISPIASTEATRLSLVALTSTGCRLFLSATAGGYYGNVTTTAPSSMQVHHIRFPPKDPATQIAVPAAQPGQVIPYHANTPGLDTNTRYLWPTKGGARYAPGFCVWVVENQVEPGHDKIFLSAPDSGRIKIPRDASQATKYPETGQWIEISQPSQGIGLVSPPFAAARTPQGFANELAVQFDQTATELAILTTTGVQTIRRRRLIDIFAAAIRYGGDSEGREGEVKKFIRLYGRSETAATALAVACGQGADVTTDFRVANITEPDVIDFARETFIQHGGKPMLNENSVLDNNTPAVDNVRPSPRHEGMSLYISRLVRSIWKAPVLVEGLSPIGGLTVSPSVSLSKLHDIQRALNSLQEFLNKNKSSIEGLAGPESLGRVSTKQEEVALQGEHRAMNSLLQLVSSIIEGIAFVLVLFDERVDEIILSLPDASRQRAKKLTFEGLFCSTDGRDLAKELVKAIVNRNIANGSNVDTVAEALRRRCGSFCSADDVVIFKAQEQVKRASEAGATSESGRMLLNESLRLFQRVAAALSMEHLEWAVSQYIPMAFYAGAIQLALTVAQESDRANRALSWLRDDSPEDDPRKSAFEARKRCYDLIHAVIQSVDQSSQQTPDQIDGQLTVTAKRKAEAYDVINNSEDEVFQNNLYDWYMAQGWSDMLLEISSPFVIGYLRRRMDKNPAHADLLWRYYAHHNNFLEAASVQLLLAKGGFALDLETRIGYLSRARTNASIRTTSLLDSRQSRQQLLHELSDLLEVANIQDDILQRMKSDPRLTAERRPQVIRHLDGEILAIDELFNQYADQASYHDICILIYHVADHRNPADIQSTWQLLIEQTHTQTEAAGEPLPYEAVALKVRSLGQRLRLADATFPIPILLPMLERYALEFQRGVGPATWVLDVFLDLEVPHEVLLPVLEQMYYTNEQPFDGRNRRVLAAELVHLIQQWLLESERRGERMVFGSEENAAGVEEILAGLIRSNDLDAPKREIVELLRGRIAQVMR